MLSITNTEEHVIFQNKEFLIQACWSLDVFKTFFNKREYHGTVGLKQNEKKNRF